MNIGEAAAASGVSAKMIRYYESVGLIPAAARGENGYRVYGPRDVSTLSFIHRARRLGFSMARIERLVDLWRNQGRASAEVKAIAEDHILELRSRAEELAAMARTLEHLARSCHGDARPDCPILEDLAGVEMERQVTAGKLPEPDAAGLVR
ncbi:MAG: Cu(I)-responsive transcriptional regulator [Amaricoccus sp.]|uniref:Cu(I)-responsive transcriptional regulator n=1 Tax=Amaricoccus sp. TaxID=1872485 RepID=UPI00331554C3